MYNNTWSQFLHFIAMCKTPFTLASESAVPARLGAARLHKCNRNPFASVQD